MYKLDNTHPHPTLPTENYGGFHLSNIAHANLTFDMFNEYKFVQKSRKAIHYFIFIFFLVISG